MKRFFYFCEAVLLLALLSSTVAVADDDIALFNQQGKPIAYVAVNDDLTIYIWGGKPVAYLHKGSDKAYDVYGFNGKHLGWFVNGAIFDHDGDASCATEGRLGHTQYEPYKGYTQYKPYKSYREYAPYQPYLSSSFGDVPCALLLGSGGK